MIAKTAWKTVRAGSSYWYSHSRGSMFHIMTT